MSVLPQHKQFQLLCKNQFKVIDQNSVILNLDGLFKRIIAIDQKLDDNRYQVGVRGLLNSEKQKHLETPLAQNQFQSILSLLQQANDRDMIRIFIFTLQQFLEYVQHNGTVNKPSSPSIQKQLLQLQEKRRQREQGKNKLRQINQNLLKQSLDAIDALEIKEQSSPQVIVASGISPRRSSNNSYSIDRRHDYSAPLIKQKLKQPISFSNESKQLKQEQFLLTNNAPVINKHDNASFTSGFNSPEYLNVFQEYQKERSSQDNTQSKSSPNQQKIEDLPEQPQIIEQKENENVKVGDQNAEEQKLPEVLNSNYLNINQINTQDIIPSVQLEDQYVYVGQQTAQFSENDYKSPKLIERDVWNKKYGLRQQNDQTFQKFIYNPSTSTIESIKQEPTMDWERVVQISNQQFNPLRSYQEMQLKKNGLVSSGTLLPDQQETIITEEMEDTATKLRLNILKQFQDKDIKEIQKDELTERMDALKEFEKRNKNVLMLNCYNSRTEYQILEDLMVQPTSPIKTSHYRENGISLTLIQE